MNYLYFAEGAVETTGEAAMYPASAFLGADPISATTTRLSFKARNNTAVDDDVLVEHASGKHVEVAELIASILEPSPVMESGRVKTEGETRPRRDFCIVHQYDRVPAWRHLIQMKYSS